MDSNTILSLTLDDFAKLFGVTLSNLPAECVSLINKLDFRFELLDQDKRDKLILSLVKLNESDLSPAGNSRKSEWEERWSKILESFIQNNYNPDNLIPDFLRRNRPIRVGQHYGLPVSHNFELNLYMVFRRWLFQKYLSEAEIIYEFACGTAFNLVELSNLYPNKELHGLDWVKPPAEIVNILSKKYGHKMTGHIFNMANPDIGFTIKPNSAILTVDGLEQLGSNFEPFLRFILSKSPSLCVQIEPLDELYDPENLIDYLALKFSRKRNYLTGYLTRLKQLEEQGLIKIIKIHKMSCGLHHEGYSFVVWQPIN